MASPTYSYKWQEKLTGSLGDVTAGCTTIRTTVAPDVAAAARRFCARAYLAGLITMGELRDTLEALGLAPDRTTRHGN